MKAPEERGALSSDRCAGRGEHQNGSTPQQYLVSATLLLVRPPFELLVPPPFGDPEVFAYACTSGQSTEITE